MIKYSELGSDKRLCEIVIAGTHDAGITEGGGNAKTQSLNIGEQAAAGVRIFDLRVAAQTITLPDGSKGAVLQTFHAADTRLIQRKAEKTRQMVDFNNASSPLTRTKLKSGAWGETLHHLLRQAKNFVTSTDGNSEFLILKFDKSTNYQYVADLCWQILGDELYAAGGNVNTKKLSELAGKVVVVFPGKAFTPGFHDHGGRILKWANLSAGAPYAAQFDGLQYFGKGGTNPFSYTEVLSYGAKINQNESTQSKLMGKANTGFTIKKGKIPFFKKKTAVGAVHADTLGMMYWTTTGIKQNIEQRNHQMWTTPNVTRLKQVWAGGLGDYIDDSIPFDVGSLPLTDRAKSGVFGSLASVFMPNIVMIDFADPAKCQIIYDLNFATANDLAQL